MCNPNIVMSAGRINFQAGCIMAISSALDNMKKPSQADVKHYAMILRDSYEELSEAIDEIMEYVFADGAAEESGCGGDCGGCQSCNNGVVDIDD